MLPERVGKVWRKRDRKEVKGVISSCSPAICHFSQIPKGILECKLCFILPSLFANCWKSLTADNSPLSSSVRIALGWRELHHAWLHCLPKSNLEQVRSLLGLLAKIQCRVSAKSHPSPRAPWEFAALSQFNFTIHPVLVHFRFCLPGNLT